MPDDETGKGRTVAIRAEDHQQTDREYQARKDQRRQEHSRQERPAGKPKHGQCDGRACPDRDRDDNGDQGQLKLQLLLEPLEVKELPLRKKKRNRRKEFL